MPPARAAPIDIFRLAGIERAAAGLTDGVEAADDDLISAEVVDSFGRTFSRPNVQPAVELGVDRMADVDGFKRSGEEQRRQQLALDAARSTRRNKELELEDFGMCISSKAKAKQQGLRDDMARAEAEIAELEIVEIAQLERELSADAEDTFGRN